MVLGVSALVPFTPAFPQTPGVTVSKASLEGSAGAEDGAGSASGGGRVSSLTLGAPPSPETQPLVLLQLRFAAGPHTASDSCAETKPCS